MLFSAIAVVAAAAAAKADGHYDEYAHHGDYAHHPVAENAPSDYAHVPAGVEYLTETHTIIDCPETVYDCPAESTTVKPVVIPATYSTSCETVFHTMSKCPDNYVDCPHDVMEVEILTEVTSSTMLKPHSAYTPVPLAGTAPVYPPAAHSPADTAYYPAKPTYSPHPYGEHGWEEHNPDEHVPVHNAPHGTAAEFGTGTGVTATQSSVVEAGASTAYTSIGLAAFAGIVALLA